MPIADLVSRAAALGYAVLPLTDINTTMGAADFVVECGRKGVRPVLGVEFRNGNELLYVALAKNNEGFAELNHFLTDHNTSFFRSSMVVSSSSFHFSLLTGISMDSTCF